MINVMLKLVHERPMLYIHNQVKRRDPQRKPAEKSAPNYSTKADPNYFHIKKLKQFSTAIKCKLRFWGQIKESNYTVQAHTGLDTEQRHAIQNIREY